MLALVALLAAHTAIYVAQDGTGDRFAQAMASGGHDGWWIPASLVVLGVGFLLLVRTLGGLAHLEIRARASGRRGGPGRAPFAPEIRSIWQRLLPLVTILFLAQENLEYVAAHGHLLGLDPLITDSGMALPMLALISFGLSVLGALLRWRVAVLRARIASPNHQARRRPVLSQVVAGRWRMVGALAPRQWMTDRLDAGRAPPRLLRV